MSRRGRDDENIHLLVHQYEEMELTDAVAFFELEDFERLLDYYEQSQKIEQALTVVEHAIHQHAYSVIPYIRKAQLLFDLKQYENASSCLDQAVAYEPLAPEIYFLHANIHLAQSNYQKALAVLEHAQAILGDEEQDNIYLALADVYEDIEQFDKGFEALKQALLINPENTEALRRIWLVVELSECYTDSITLHEKLIDDYPYLHLAWYNLGHAYFCLHRYEQAVEAYEYAFVIDEGFDFAYLDCAEAYRCLGKYEKAIDCYGEVMDRVKEDAELLVSLGNCYAQLNQHSEAKNYYLNAIQVNPSYAGAHFKLGESYALEESWWSAVGSYRKAVELDNRNADYVAALAKSWEQLGEIERAQTLFQAAIELAPEESIRWIEYILFLLDHDAAEQSLDVLDDASLHCSGIALQYCRAACLFILGHRKAGFEELEYALGEDYSKYNLLFEFYPELKDDLAVLQLIDQYNA